MAILTDGIHLISTINEDELHTFAQSIGLKREWYQCHSHHRKRKRPHYDLTTKRALDRAIANGAMLVSGISLIRNAWWNIKPCVTCGKPNDQWETYNECWECRIDESW